MWIITKLIIEIRKNKNKFNIAKAISFVLLAFITFMLNDCYNILKPNILYKNEPTSMADTTSQKSDSSALKIKNHNTIKTDSINSNINLKSDTTINL